MMETFFKLDFKFNEETKTWIPRYYIEPIAPTIDATSNELQIKAS